MHRTEALPPTPPDSDFKAKRFKLGSHRKGSASPWLEKGERFASASSSEPKRFGLKQAGRGQYQNGSGSYAAFIGKEALRSAGLNPAGRGSTGASLQRSASALPDSNFKAKRFGPAPGKRLLAVGSLRSACLRHWSASSGRIFSRRSASLGSAPREALQSGRLKK